MNYNIQQHFDGSYKQTQPLFDELKNKVEQFGYDIHVYARKNWIALKRKGGFRFLLVKVYTNSLNVGICTRSPFPTNSSLNRVFDGLLEPASRVKYIVKIASISHINKELLQCIWSAYQEGTEKFQY